MAARRFKITICRGPECGDQRGSEGLEPVFRAALDRHCVKLLPAGASAPGAAAPSDDRGNQAAMDWQSCFGRCSQGPNVLVREILERSATPSLGTGFATVPGPRGATALYNRVDAARVERIVEGHVAGGKIVRDLIEPPTAAVPAPTPGETP